MPFRGACGVAALWPVVGVAVVVEEEVVVPVGPGEDREFDSPRLKVITGNKGGFVKLFTSKEATGELQLNASQ